MIGVFTMGFSESDTGTAISEFPCGVTEIFKSFEMNFFRPAIFGVVGVFVVKSVVNVFLGPGFE